MSLRNHVKNRRRRNRNGEEESSSGSVTIEVDQSSPDQIDTPAPPTFLRSLRIQELYELHTFVSRLLSTDRRRKVRNGIAFVVGSPGTGKTSGVNAYLEGLKDNAEWLCQKQRKFNPTDLKVVRFTAFSSNSLLFRKAANKEFVFLEFLLNALGSRTSREFARCAHSVDEMLTYIAVKMKDESIVLCIDEFDQLSALELSVNYTAFEIVLDLVASYLPRCVLIAISNDPTIDVAATDHYEKYRKCPPLEKIEFAAYSYEQLKDLYEHRTGEANPDKAIEYGIRRIANQKGDGRLLLDMLSRLTIAGSRPSSPTRPETEPATIDSVKELFGTAFAPELQRLLSTLRHLPAQHQYVVCALHRLVMDKAPSKDSPPVWIGVRPVYTLYKRLRTQIDGAGEVLSFAAFQNTARSLAVSGVLQTKEAELNRSMTILRTPMTPKTPGIAMRRRHTPHRHILSVQVTPMRPSRVSSPRFGSPERNEGGYIAFTACPRKVRMALNELSDEPGPFMLLARKTADSSSEDELL